MGLGESSSEGNLYGWLTGSEAGVGPKNTYASMDVLFTRNGFLVMTCTVSSLHTCHLLEVWDDTFDIMYQAMPAGRSVKRCSPARNCRTVLLMGA